MWDTTPSEWSAVCEGAREAERQQRLGFASIVAVVMSALGNPMDPRAIIGEPVEYGENPFGPDDSMTPEARKAFRDAQLAKIRERAHLAWLPRRLATELGVVEDDLDLGGPDGSGRRRR